MADYSGILFDVRDGVGTITLNRPAAANALDHQASMELVDALIRCEENREVRAVVLTGNGLFSAPAPTSRASTTAATDSRPACRSSMSRRRESCARRSR